MKLDQFKDVYLVIDKANDVFIQRQFVSQGDYKGRSLTVQVTNNGNVGEVPGLTLNLNWHNEASGLTDLTAFNVLDKKNSIFRIEYPDNMMTPGKVYASIQIIQDGKVTNLRQFELIVQKLAGQPVGIAEKAEFSALVAVLADSNKFRTDIDKKADKNYINDYLSKVTVVPETFANLAAIKAKYPNGKNGLMVAADNGHKYIWANNVWTDAGIYQAVGIADNSIMYKQAAKNIINFRAYSYSKIPDYNSTTKQLTFNSDVIVEIGNGNIDSTNRFTISSGTVVTNQITSGGFFKIVYDTITNSVTIIGQKDDVGNNQLVLATFSNTGLTSGELKITYNGAYTDSTKDVPYLNMISGGDPTDGLYKGIVLRFDVDNKKLIIPKFSSTLVLRDNSGNRFDVTDTVTVDITPVFSSPFSGYVVYDRTTNLFSYQNYDYAFKGNVDSVIASVRYVNSKLHVYSKLNNLTIDTSDMFNGLSKQVLLPNSGSQQIYTSLPLNDTVNKYPNFIPTQRKIVYPHNTSFYTANGKVSYTASDLTIDLSYDYATSSNIVTDFAAGAIFFNQLRTRFEFWSSALPSDLTGYYIHSWVSYNIKGPDMGTWQTTTPYLTEGTLIRNPLKNEVVSLIKQNASSDDASLPDYYTDYIAGKYDEINSLMESITDGDAFIFITDTHWGDNVQLSPKLIDHIRKNTNVQKVIFGGDIVTAFGTKNAINDNVYGFNGIMKKYVEERNYFPTIGNHDFTIKYSRSADDQTGYTYDVPYTYNNSTKMLESYAGIQNQKMYYYFDNPVQKVRYIMVNTEEEVNSGDNPWGVGAHITQQQLDWLTNDALNVPSDDWHVVTVGHVPIHPYAPGHDGALNILRYALEGYTNKSKASFTATYGTILNTDFSTYKGKMVGYFCGHNHKDTEFVGTNMVNISTGCDATYNDDVWKRIAGTLTEQLFDVVIVDKTNKKINMVRIGAGENRNYSYTQPQADTIINSKK